MGGQGALLRDGTGRDGTDQPSRNHPHSLQPSLASPQDSGHAGSVPSVPCRGGGAPPSVPFWGERLQRPPWWEPQQAGPCSLPTGGRGERSPRGTRSLLALLPHEGRRACSEVERAAPPLTQGLAPDPGDRVLRIPHPGIRPNSISAVRAVLLLQPPSCSLLQRSSSGRVHPGCAGQGCSEPGARASDFRGVGREARRGEAWRRSGFAQGQEEMAISCWSVQARREGGRERRRRWVASPLCSGAPGEWGSLMLRRLRVCDGDEGDGGRHRARRSPQRCYVSSAPPSKFPMHR